MTTEQLLLTKWQILEPDKQKKVLAFIDSLTPEKASENLGNSSENTYQPQTELGKKLWVIRQKIVNDPNVKLLEWDDIKLELDEIRDKK